MIAPHWITDEQLSICRNLNRFFVLRWRRAVEVGVLHDANLLTFGYSAPIVFGEEGANEDGINALRGVKLGSK